MERPLISIVMPTYNRANNLEKFLENIESQTYPKECIEVVLAEGYSQDNTLQIAEKHGCKVIQHPTTDIEERRRMAVENARGEWIFMADDDNYFKNPSLLENMMDAVTIEGAYAAECAWQYYDKKDYAINRYCALIGAYDPAVYYLHRQDHMRIIDSKWCLKGKVIRDTEKYFLLHFDPEDVPTMGDQGFLIRKSDMLKGNTGKVIMHMDACVELSREGKGQFIFMKDFFGHDCVQKYGQLVKKLKRNVDRFQVDGDERSMNYSMNFAKMIKLGVVLGTVVIPLKDAIYGFCKKPDIAWFIHPFLCFHIACLYTVSTVKAKFTKQK